jgi:selenocysteine lyase/cysteine desulfurase
VRVRPLRPAGERLTAAEVAAAIGPRTRLLAVTWVDSFTDVHLTCTRWAQCAAGRACCTTLPWIASLELLLAAGIDIAYREGNLRISVHLFNEPGQIDRALAALRADGPR